MLILIHYGLVLHNNIQNKLTVNATGSRSSAARGFASVHKVADDRDQYLLTDSPIFY